jgi:3'(2'), 5'-bisphosphate nucleotidase
MLDNLLDLARSVGWGAADVLRSYYRSGNDLEIQQKGTAPVTAADLAANRYILERFHSELGTEDFGYMSEETFQPGPPYPQRYVWIIDPLDGTRDFIDKTGQYALHIALVEAGHPILAVVAWPEAEKLYAATKGGGAFVEDRQGNRQGLRVSQRGAEGSTPTERMAAQRLVVSRTHRDQRFNQLLNRLPQTDQKYVGSVGLKIATIVEQEAEIYPIVTTQSAPKDWDLAAPELILTEAGGQLSHFDLTPLQYNRGDVKQWGGCLASNGQGHAELCQLIEQTLADIDRAGEKSR